MRTADTPAAAPTIGELALPRVARGGRSFDFAGYRIRLEAVHGDPNVPAVVELIVGAITDAHARQLAGGHWADRPPAGAILAGEARRRDALSAATA